MFIIANYVLTNYISFAHVENNGVAVGVNDTKPSERCKGYCGIQWCDGYGMLLILTVITYFCLFYYNCFKPKYGEHLYGNYLEPLHNCLSSLVSNRYV